VLGGLPKLSNSIFTSASVSTAAQSITIAALDIRSVSTGYSEVRLETHHELVVSLYQGIAAALAELARAHMEPDLALVVLESLGLWVADLKKTGADPHDLEALQK
jgi:hypothetical protein